MNLQLHSSLLRMRIEEAAVNHTTAFSALVAAAGEYHQYPSINSAANLLQKRVQLVRLQENLAKILSTEPPELLAALKPFLESSLHITHPS